MRKFTTNSIIEMFGTHLNFFLENEPVLYGFTCAKTGSTFRFLFVLEHVICTITEKGVREHCEVYTDGCSHQRQPCPLPMNIELLNTILFILSIIIPP